MAKPPAPDPADPNAPPPPPPADTLATPQHRERGRGGRGRVVGHSEILSGQHTAPTTAPNPRNTKRKKRAFCLHPDLVTCIKASGMKRADLIVMAAERYADEIAHTPRNDLPGRQVIVVGLTDTEHRRLQRIAQRRAWSVSSSVSALLEFYLTEIEAAQNKRPKRARAKP